MGLDTPGLPTPKYGVGSQFWVARVDTTTEQLPCPDCLGTRTWKATSPAGVEHDLACPRCGGGYSAITNVPSLKHVVHVGRAELFTVGGMEIRSHGFEHGGHDQRVSYYSSPQGGSVFHEHQAYDSEETALGVAMRAAGLNAAAQATPEHMEKMRFSALTLRDAAMTSACESASGAWWAYSFLKEDVEAAIENDGAGYRDFKDLCDELRRHLAFDREQYRPPSAVPLYDALGEVLAAFDDMTDDNLGFLVTEEVAKRSLAAVAAVKTARAAMREFIKEAKK